VNRKYIPIYIQQDATLHSLFVYGNCSTCFGWYLHPSSGAHTTVFTASVICHGVTNTRCCRYVVCALDDGWMYQPKHVEQFPDIHKKTLHLVGHILEYKYSSLPSCDIPFVFGNYTTKWRDALVFCF